MADQLFRILAALDNHVATDDQLPADATRWRELKRHVERMLDGWNLARIELESFERGAPQTKELVRQALQYVRFVLVQGISRAGRRAVLSFRERCGAYGARGSGPRANVARGQKVWCE